LNTTLVLFTGLIATGSWEKQVKELARDALVSGMSDYFYSAERMFPSANFSAA